MNIIAFLINGQRHYRPQNRYGSFSDIICPFKQLGFQSMAELSNQNPGFNRRGKWVGDILKIEIWIICYINPGCVRLRLVVRLST